MTLKREGRGRNFGGMDSQVSLPMMQALTRVGGDVVGVVVVEEESPEEEVSTLEVILAKKAMSPLRRQGSLPLRPIPLARSAATTMEKETMRDVSR